MGVTINGKYSNYLRFVKSIVQITEFLDKYQKILRRHA